MARITSHALNGIDGTHAGGIPVKLSDLDTGNVLFQTVTAEDGRLDETIGAEKIAKDSRLEMVLSLSDYWNSRGISEARLIDEVVLRFTVDDVRGHYHMPVIVSPHGYSTWKSG